MTNKKECLPLSALRKNLPFLVSTNLSVFSINSIVSGEYALDFDVYLPSIGQNLQRELVWTLLQKQALILSILKGIKLPAIALIEVTDKKFEVIDGKQRLSAWIGFVKGDFPVLHAGQAYFFEDLDFKCQVELGKKHVVADVVYQFEDPMTDAYKIEWFTRINFSGTPQDVAHMESLGQAELSGDDESLPRQ